MVKTLIIVPTKNRLVAVNCLLQNLIMQEGDFDIFIGDMSDRVKYEDDWYFMSQLEHLRLCGHNFFHAKIYGTNQLYALQAGVDYAVHYGYDLCLDTDDDICFSKEYFKKGIKIMSEHPEVGILVGPTLAPTLSDESQKVESEFWDYHPDFQGKLSDEPQYAHCIFIPPTNNIRECEQIYGAFFFRPQEANAVGGFPLYLSRQGFRGEMILQAAIFYSGKKVWLNPDMLSWHYQDRQGGLRELELKEREINKNKDIEFWKFFWKQRKASTRKEDYNYGGFV